MDRCGSFHSLHHFGWRKGVHSDPFYNLRRVNYHVDIGISATFSLKRQCEPDRVGNRWASASIQKNRILWLKMTKHRYRLTQRPLLPLMEINTSVLPLIPYFCSYFSNFLWSTRSYVLSLILSFYRSLAFKSLNCLVSHDHSGASCHNHSNHKSYYKPDTDETEYSWKS